METVIRHANTSLIFFSSYPTYEEWKLRSNSPNRPRGSSGSYPTYEEWKQEALKLLEKNEFVFLSYL